MAELITENATAGTDLTGAVCTTAMRRYAGLSMLSGSHIHVSTIW